MRHGSLFSGIGGFDLAALWLGWENIFNVEIDPFCRHVLKYHFPLSVQFDDIKKFDAKKYYGTVDIISGGFPCQPFSLAGQRLGKDDDRYLWPEMLRVIDEIRPAWVVGENVAGILSMVQPGLPIDLAIQTHLSKEDQEIITEHEFIIESIYKDIEGIGYSVQPFLIPACSIGAPHRRNRVWFIANSYGSIQRQEFQKETNGNSDKNRAKVPAESSSIGGGRIITYPYGERLEGATGKILSSGTDGQFTRISAIPAWESWPTQPPVCGRNDGISSSLADITFSKWRKESLRSFGNAIVPQVAYQIFSTIESVHQKKLKYESIQ